MDLSDPFIFVSSWICDYAGCRYRVHHLHVGRWALMLMLVFMSLLEIFIFVSSWMSSCWTLVLVLVLAIRVHVFS